MASFPLITDCNILRSKLKGHVPYPNVEQIFIDEEDDFKC